nr:hypothetical protein [Tanacetum cinerariifolium]
DKGKGKVDDKGKENVDDLQDKVDRLEKAKSKLMVSEKGTKKASVDLVDALDLQNRIKKLYEDFNMLGKGKVDDKGKENVDDLQDKVDRLEKAKSKLMVSEKGTKKASVDLVDALDLQNRIKKLYEDFNMLPLSLSFDFIFDSEIFKSFPCLSLSSFPSCDLVS